MKPRRIVYVVRVFPKVSETFVANELAELGRRGVKVRILSVREPAEKLRHAIITRAGLAERTIYDHDRFSQVFEKFKPDLVHAHFATKATAVARRLATSFDVPFTFTAHRYDIYDKPPKDFAERGAAAKAIVTVSKANRRYIVKNFGVPAKKVHVIPCGVDTNVFRPNGESREPGCIVCVARLAQCKNHKILLEACAQLQAQGLKFRCVLVGDGPHRNELDALRNRLGLTLSVQMVGATEQTEVLRWWRRASIAVLPSESEGMPVSLMEAGACGVPAVATAVGGVPELIDDGVTGILTPPGSASALADAMQWLLLSPKFGARMGVAARRHVEKSFSLSQQGESLLALWGNLLNGGGKQ